MLQQIVFFPTHSTIEEEELADKLTSSDGNPDACTNHYINSLRMRSDVKTALKSHLDSLNCDLDNANQHSTDKDKEGLSEANVSMATSEISNCDSKDVAELDSMLSTSPHHNGFTHDDTDLEHDVTRAAGNADVTTNNDVTCNSSHGNNDVSDDVTNDNNLTRNNDVTHDNDVTQNDVTETSFNQISPVGEDDTELSSVEKSKRVLFCDDRDVFEIEQGKTWNIQCR